MLKAVAVSVKTPVVKQPISPEEWILGFESHGLPLPFFRQMLSPVKMLMIVISMLTVFPVVTVCVRVVNWLMFGEIVPICGGAVMAGWRGEEFVRGLGIKVTVAFGAAKLLMVESDETEVGELFAGVSGVELGFGGFSTKGAVRTGEFEGLLVGVAAAALELAIWTLGEPEKLPARVTVVLLGLAGFSTKVTVSMLEFDRLLAKVIVVVLGPDGFATKGITLEPDGLLASVTVVVLGFAGSAKVIVSTVSGFCTEVTVLTLELVAGEAAADSLAATKVTVAAPFTGLLSVCGASAEGSCLA